MDNGKVSMFVAFLIPFNLMEKKRLKKQRIIAGLSSFILYLIVITPQIEADKTIGFGHDALGAGGMFVAIFCGIFTGFVMSMFGKFSFFKEDSVIPDFVKAWFDAMLPIAVVICAGWIVVLIMKFDLYNLVLAIFMPLSNFIQTPYGFVFVMFLYCFLYSMGISTWVLTPVTQPVLLAAIASNIAIAQTGAYTASQLSLVTSSTLFSAYLWIGGVGCTLPLVIMLICSKAKELNTLGKAFIVPSIFNINEPVVFGTIAWNPYLMIPMWMQGIILPIIVYVFTKVIPFAPIPVVQFEMWYCPFPIATWFTTGSVRGLMLFAIVFIASAVVWYPFFKAYEGQKLKAAQE